VALRQEIYILFILMLNSKGAATITGGGWITLAATLSALGGVPVAGIALLIGGDRFLSEMRSVQISLVKGAATILIS
jgi:aerobic C4-dicarboxylate transport protein